MSVHNPDQKLVDALGESSKDDSIACGAVFAVIERLQVDPAEAGKALDLLEISIKGCQLGLFGYSPNKKIVKPAESVPGDLEKEIRSRLSEGRLPCAEAWAIAAAQGMSKMDVAAACETLGVKISRCQIGAF
ncbi:MAG: hypothetical protein JW838_09015 [Spirochaetes bacterium]|nr:hypothetical protein [Spirochaetota bacterium]